jgi:predicted HTH transcriptional regulator
MSLRFSSTSNNFGTFLDTVNAGKPGVPAERPFDVEAVAKQVLQLLHETPMTEDQLRENLKFKHEQIDQAVRYLSDAEMAVAHGDGGLINLTDFAYDALKIFSVA